MPANGYHGSWDQVSLSGTDEAHPDGAEGVVPAGIPEVLADIIHFVRFNDIGHLEELLSRHGSETAAIILEPILGHILEAGDPEFMRAALRLAHESGALLILDETITYRLHVGGWQAQHGIEADLTTLGKTIAGGMPLGAFGGKEHIMRIFDPRIPEPLAAHGTMNGSPLCLAAGCASLDLLDQPTIDRINGLAGSLSRLLNAVGERSRPRCARAQLRFAAAGQPGGAAGLPQGLPRGRPLHRAARQHEPVDADGRRRDRRDRGGLEARARPDERGRSRPGLTGDRIVPYSAVDAKEREARWRPRPVSLLDRQALDRIHVESLQILAEIGVRVENARCRDVLERAGAKAVGQTDIVRLPAAMVEEAMAQLTRTYDLAHPGGRRFTIPDGRHARVSG